MLIKINSNGSLKVKLSVWKPTRVIVEEGGMKNLMRRLQEKRTVVTTLYVNSYDENGEIFVPAYFRGWDEHNEPIVEEIRDPQKCKGYSFLSVDDLLKLLDWKRRKLYSKMDKLQHDRITKSLREVLLFVKNIQSKGKVKIGAGV